MTPAHPAAVAPTEDIRQAVQAGHARLATLTAGLTDADVTAPSALPGWQRGHVLTHLINLADAIVRQTEHAARGELVDFYDGGRPARDAAIEAGANRPADVLRAELLRAHGRLDQVWAGLDPAVWDSPVSYRDGTLHGILLAAWREVEIHGADLLLGYTPADWSPAFLDHLMRFLAPRAPEGTELVLVPVDSDRRWLLGAGNPVEVTGAAADLASWVAGRAPGDALVATDRSSTAGRPVPLPLLAPWP